jgi:hypothetical protein
MSEEPKKTFTQQVKTDASDFSKLTLKNKASSGASNLAKGLYQTTKGIGKLATATAILPGKLAYAAVSKPVKLAAEGAKKVESASSGITIVDKFKEQVAQMDATPSFYKVVFLIFFYFFFYSIFYDIGKFFGFDDVELILYMAWFGILLLFLSFIKSKRSRLN